jgi:heat shock protein HtpX
MNSAVGARELDTSRLKRGGFLLGLGLVISSWIGLVIGALGMAGTLIALPAAAAWLAIGFFAVPLFGLLFGSVGMRMALGGTIRKLGVRIIPPDGHPVESMVAALAARMGLPRPQVGIYPDDDVNAFAAGSSPHKALVAFTQGAIDRMEPGELMAVAAHELAHVANRDMMRLQFATSFQKSLTWFVGWTDRGQSFVRWLLGFVGELLVLKLSRQREFWADATAAAVVGPERMIAALRRLDGDPVEPSAKRLAYARLMIRPNPRTWFSTHPPIPDRIRALHDGTYLNRLPYR